MKRSKNTNIQRMLKGHACTSLIALAIAGALTCTGCEDNEEKVRVVSSVENCVTQTKMSKQECEDAYKKAVAEAERTGPKFENSKSCEEQFGPSQCHRSDSGVWMPLMTGFMIGNMLGNSGGHNYHNPVYTSHSGNSSGKYVTATGTTIGSPGKTSYSVNKSSTTSQPKSSVATTKTITRGGFGSKGSAKSSWGSSSKSSSWGS